jgi:hypothetical protein
MMTSWWYFSGISLMSSTCPSRSTVAPAGSRTMLSALRSWTGMAFAVTVPTISRSALLAAFVNPEVRTAWAPSNWVVKSVTVEVRVARRPETAVTAMSVRLKRPTTSSMKAGLGW